MAAVWAFTTAQDYVDRAKQLAQDIDGVRYTADTYFHALNMGIQEAYRLRPDFYRTGETAVPVYDPSTPAMTIDFPKQYAMHLITFIVGMIELTDSEGNEDARAAALITSFGQKLTRMG